MRLRSAVTATLVALALTVSGCGSTVGTGRTSDGPSSFVTSGECPRERALVRKALDRSTLRADVDGDGRPDTVAAASDPGADKPCRGFVGVRLEGGATYSTHLVPEAAPIKGLEAEVVGLPRLGSAPGAQVVVDTKAAVDSLLAQMFTFARGGLRPVDVPGLEDGTFIVEGGGVIYPFGASCTASGQLVLSRAAQTEDGASYHVTRRVYEPRGAEVGLVDPTVTRSTVPVSRLVDQFPEFAGSHWKACTDRRL